MLIPRKIDGQPSNDNDLRNLTVAKIENLFYASAEFGSAYEITCFSDNKEDAIRQVRENIRLYE